MMGEIATETATLGIKNAECVGDIAGKGREQFGQQQCVTRRLSYTHTKVGASEKCRVTQDDDPARNYTVRIHVYYTLKKRCLN